MAISEEGDLRKERARLNTAKRPWQGGDILERERSGGGTTLAEDGIVESVLARHANQLPTAIAICKDVILPPQRLVGVRQPQCAERGSEIRPASS